MIRVGHGHACGHHGELLQGEFSYSGTRVRGLVTLPIPTMVTEAVFTPSPQNSITVTGQRWKSHKAATLTLAHLRTKLGAEMKLSDGGSLSHSSSIAPGLGLGSSTADVLATIRAVADAHGVQLSPSEQAMLAVSAEGASDPVMFDADKVMLFAQRSGRVLHRWQRPLPALTLVGCRCGEPVDTEQLHLTARSFTAAEVEDFNALRLALAAALHRGDPKAIGHVATTSAQLNQSRRAFPQLSELMSIGQHCQAIGVQIAHSGCVGGLLFAGHHNHHTHPHIAACRNALRSAGLTPTVEETIGAHHHPTRRPRHR